MYYVARNFIIYVIFINAFTINTSIQTFSINILLIYNNTRVCNILPDRNKYT